MRQVNAWLAVAVAIPFSMLLGLAIYELVYRPLQTRGRGFLPPFIASLGCYFVLSNGLSMFMGQSARPFDLPIPRFTLDLWGTFLTSSSLIVLLTAAVVAFLLFVFFQRVPIGIAIRALGNDAELSRLLGLDTRRTTEIVFLVGSV